MSVTAIVGGNWGDEGKGKMTDFLAGRADIVVRYQGGRNAGHTIINDYGKFVLHLLPSGVFRAGVVNVLGPGVAVDIAFLLGELAELASRGVPAPKLLVSERAQVLLPVHVLLDQYEEERLGATGFGSTQTGIAPFYADKCMKVGIQICDLYDPTELANKLRRNLEAKQVILRAMYGRPPIDVENLAVELGRLAKQVESYVADTTSFLQRENKRGAHILLEGQLGALRDPDNGIYPFSTSSSPLAGYASVGAGIPPHQIGRIVAVVKAYSSCVGTGPFVTELQEPAASELRKRGGSDGEFGATTGRPRRMGWFDAVATRYGCALQGATELTLSLLDVLGYLDEIPICTGYEIDGKITEQFPVTRLLSKAKPIYERMPGWKCDISDARRFSDLPESTRAYVARIEELIGIPVGWISVGPARDAVIRFQKVTNLAKGEG